MALKANYKHTQPSPIIELYQCILCPYKSSRKSNLKKHFMIHTKEKPFKCYDCNFCAATKSTLLLHVRTHTGEKPYECAICQRKFSRRNIIKGHVKTHTNDKPFKCSECNFITSRKDNLKFHMRRHLAEKPFKCHLCNSSFVQKCRFKRHLELHTKVFRCLLCYYQTHLEVNLVKHKLSHKMNVLICFLCGKKFGKKYGLRVHIMKLHNKEECHKKNGNQFCNPENSNNANTNINPETSQLNKTFSDKAIATDDIVLFSQAHNTTNQLYFSTNSVKNLQLPNVESDMHQHDFTCPSTNCELPYTCISKPPNLSEILESNLVYQELNLNLMKSESSISNSMDVPNFNNTILYDTDTESSTEYSNSNVDSSVGSSSSDSEVDSVIFPYTANIRDVQENVVVEQNSFQNVFLNSQSEVFLNYHPNINYIVGLNLMQPVVIPTVSLQPNLSSSSSLVLASGFNNMQVNQDINFVPISNHTNLFVNNLVSSVADSNLMLNPTKTVFVSEMY